MLKKLPQRRFINLLRALMELHTPTDMGTYTICTGCGEYYPCLTMRQIEEVL